MKLSELIRRVGDDNVQFQGLIGSIVGIKDKKADVEVTFATGRDKINSTAVVTGKGAYVGLVVWLPREKMDAAMAEAKQHAEGGK